MVYISAHNIVSSLGFNSDENILNIRHNISGVKLHTDKIFSAENSWFSSVDRNKFDKIFESKFGNLDYNYFDKLLIFSVSEALANSKINISDNKTLIIISTTKGNIDLLKTNPQSLDLYLYKSAELLQQFFKTQHLPKIISNACISGTLAISAAKKLLDAKLFENIVVTGADIISEFVLSGFQSFKAVASSVCKPFDKNRDGINLGEAAATLILSTNKQFALQPEIFISGAASSNDANHISGPSRTGEELAFAVNTALEQADLSQSQVDYISAHGTATPYNDEMEAKALNLLHLENVPLTSVKSKIGHTLGAAGIIETIIGISAIENKEIYPTNGFSGKGENLNVNTVYLKKNIQTVLKTASGFGGCNAALVISENPGKNYFTEDESNIFISDFVVLRENYFYENYKKNEFNYEADFNFSSFVKQIYQTKNINYPKFYKMDNLSKLAFITAELLLSEKNILQKYKPEEIAVIISNASSSLDTDAKYQASVSDRNSYFPTPAVFVYTLANIMVGEISIKHNIKGENAVFVSKDFDIDFIKSYVEILFKTGKTKAVIFGRTELEYPSGKYESVLYFAEKNTNRENNFNITNINKIYNLK